jgi:hypothetical protein
MPIPCPEDKIGKPRDRQHIEATLFQFCFKRIKLPKQRFALGGRHVAVLNALLQSTQVRPKLILRPRKHLDRVPFGPETVVQNKLRDVMIQIRLELTMVTIPKVLVVWHFLKALCCRYDHVHKAIAKLFYLLPFILVFRIKNANFRRKASLRSVDELHESYPMVFVEVVQFLLIHEFQNAHRLSNPSSLVNVTIVA